MRLAPALIVAASLAAGGCGEQREDVSRTVPQPLGPVPQVDPRAVAVVEASLGEYQIAPARPRVPSPGVVTFTATNDGTVAHALAVDGPAGQVRTPALVPGQRTTITLDLPAGQYKWYCPILDHERRGMAGRVSVAE